MLRFGISVIAVNENFVRLSLVPIIALHELSVLLFKTAQFFKLIAPSTLSSLLNLRLEVLQLGGLIKILNDEC
jgi:hypothetical protein